MSKHWSRRALASVIDAHAWNSPGGLPRWEMLIAKIESGEIPPDDARAMAVFKALREHNRGLTDRMVAWHSSTSSR
jgi:hypothetical protein